MPKRRMQTTSFDLVFENTLIRHRETIRKSYSMFGNEERIPLVIQIFLWRQSNPFIKQKFGNLTDASAIIFDQVLVGNVLHGLSPSLTDAINNIPRWLLTKAAFPHVLHACSSMIEHNLHYTHQSIPSLSPSSFLLPTSPSRSPSALSQLPLALNLPILRSSSAMITNRSFQSSDIHLFRTLHHLLLYFNDHHEQLISLNTIQLFLYLFLPYMHSYMQQNEKEFLLHNDLIEGWKCIWQPLVEYQQPNLRIFTTLVRSEIGSTTPIQSTDSQEFQSDTLLADTRSDPLADHSPTTAPLAHMSSICSVSDSLLPTIVEQPPKQDSCHSSLASYFDIAIIRTLFSPSWSIDGYRWCLQYLVKRLTDISDRQLPFSHRKSASSFHLNSNIFINHPMDSIAHLDLATHHLHLLDPSSFLFKPIPLTQSNLSRMKPFTRSDSTIHYKHLERLLEAPGATGYIHSDGTMNYNFILAGIHAIICKEYHLKIYESVLNLLNLICNFNVFSSNDNEQFDRMENEKFQLAIDIILRILKRLGCQHCQARSPNVMADQLREKVRLILKKLHSINEKRFEKSFANLADNGELIQILDIFHALCGFCQEPKIGLGHYAPYIVKENENDFFRTYANNFNDPSKTINGLILNVIFKPLITRLYLQDKYRSTAENITLYSECRAFLLYMKEHHGGIFRSATFSALIDSEKALKNNREKGNAEIDLHLIRMGLLRLNFLMESCPPGSLPDPEFLHSFLYLNAPILSKAAFMIECAYFVRRCADGQWPEWMRLNFIPFRSQEIFVGGQRNGNASGKTTKIYQAAAGRMFYLWGEALASQLESILDNEKDSSHKINTGSFDDYYNEAIVNPSGHDCPYVLQLIICLLLYEITRFLREIFPTLPKLSSLSNTTVSQRATRTNNSQTVVESSTDKRTADYLRADSLASQKSNRSTFSTSSEQPTFSPHALSATIINMNPLIHERHISFAIHNENDSNDSRHTAIFMNEDDGKDGNIPPVPPPPSKSKLIRRNSARTRKLSVRTKEKNAQRGSFRKRRRSHASNFFTDPDTHLHHAINSNAEPVDLSRKTHSDDDQFDDINNRPYPWLKIVSRIFNQINSISNKQIHNCQNFFQALLNMYRVSSTQEISKNNERKQRFSTYLFGDETMNLTKREEADRHFQTISKYLEKEVTSLIQIPLMILCKSAVVLEEEHYADILPLSWQVLLDRNEELVSCAATMVILTAARAGHLIDRLIQTEMLNSSALIRYNAILRFNIIWRFRYHFWTRLEENAQLMMKILPPSIEFALPSPALGLANLQIVDPPWMPHAKTLVQQVAFNQEEVRTVVTTSKTRKKHQQESLHNALMTEEISKQVARENFDISSVAMLQSASFEPLLHQSKEDEDEAYMDDERTVDNVVQLRQAQGVFPSAFGSAIFQLIEMLEDEEVIDNGAIVSGAARHALWTCLVDEPSLFIRFFFEKISQKERRIQSLQKLHSLMIYLVDIPSQFAHAIFNYVLGLLLSMIRSPLDGSPELIIAGLTLLWQIIPYVHGLVLKDFKQILRKEQAEMLILITGNIPSTKKVIIHGPDLSQIPTQAIISEETQFNHVLQEALEFFNIPDSKRDTYHLMDIKTQQILIPDTYVRDFYFFRRNIYPQFALISLDSKQSQRQLEQIALGIKTMELSKVLFARYLIESTPVNQIHNYVTFFHDELIKSPLFPRKPLESDFNLYMKISEKELWNLDMLHKYNWIKLIACLFFNMDGKTATTWDITSFLPVINGAFILHCEDLPMLRFCLATYLNIVKHFRHIFATNGYLFIMPTLLRVYSNIQSNPMLRHSIEYCCRQFFTLHRIPFLLQMLGSISPLLDLDEQAEVTDTNKIQPLALFRLLLALEKNDLDAMRDEYSILELVKQETMTMKVLHTPVVAVLGQGTMMATSTIKSLDFCYADDQTKFTLLNCFDVCVTVVAYEPESSRSLQMLSIIDTLLSKYFKALTEKTVRDDVKIMQRLSIVMKTMINACESFTRTFVEPKSETLAGGHYKHSRSSHRSPSIVPDEDSMNRFLDDRTKSRAQDADDRKQASEFRWPRDTLLSIVSTYIHFFTQPSKDSIKRVNNSIVHFSDLLDAKSHNRLAEIAQTLLKLSSFDPLTISSRGLQNYFQKLLPFTNWSDEQLRPALNLLLRRLDRMFLKVCKKPMIKRCFDWEATAGILNGLYSTIERHPYIAYYPNLKTLVSGCIALILNENLLDSNHSVPRLDTPTFPKEFSRAVIQLVGKYLLAIKYQPHLEILTNNHWSPSNFQSTINNFVHFLLPLMFWAGSGRKDAPKLHSIDISYIVTILLNSIKSPTKLATTMGTQTPSSMPSARPYLTVGEGLLSIPTSAYRSMKHVKDLLQIGSFLGLKILLISFPKQLKREWPRIIQGIKSMCNKQSNISFHLLSFLDFLISYPTPIYLILRPFLLHYMHSVTSETDYEMIRYIQQKLVFERIAPAKSMNEILHGLFQELNQLKSEFTDEPKSSSHFSDFEAIHTPDNLSNYTRSRHHRTAQTYHLRRQHPVEEFPSNFLPRKRTEKIRMKDALEILEPYYTRYQQRCAVPNKELPSYSSTYSMSLSRSITIDNERTSGLTVESASQRLSTMTEKSEGKLRTFHGWKRTTGQLDKSRLSKNSWLSQVPSEATTVTSEEMHTIFRSVQQVNEENFDRLSSKTEVLY